MISWLRRWAIRSFIGSKRVRILFRVATLKMMTRVGVMSRRRERRRVVGLITGMLVFVMLGISRRAIRIIFRRVLVMFVGMVIIFMRVSVISMVRL